MLITSDRKTGTMKRFYYFLIHCNRVHALTYATKTILLADYCLGDGIDIHCVPQKSSTPNLWR